jgi:hypothetical protein
MKATSRTLSQLQGFNAVESVYNIPFVDPFYKPGSLPYSVTPISGDFRTTNTFYDPSRQGNRSQRGGTLGNSGNESDEQAKGAYSMGANENFAIGAVLLLTAAFFVYRSVK